MAFLFDTDAISEVLKPRPHAGYVAWLGTVPRDDQFASAITIGELFYGAYRTESRERHLDMLATRVLPAVTVLPFDADVAHVYGLDLVTGNLKHFACVPDLTIRPLRSST